MVQALLICLRVRAWARVISSNASGEVIESSDRDQVGGIRRREFGDLRLEARTELTGEGGAARRDVFAPGVVLECTHPGQRHQRAGLLVQVEAGVDEEGDSRVDVAVRRRGREEQMRVPLGEQLVGLLLDVGEAVEVAEDRRHRHTRAFGDVLGRWRPLALQDQLERGTDDRLPAPLAARMSAIARFDCLAPHTRHPKLLNVWIAIVRVRRVTAFARTDDSHFDALADWPYEPHYHQWKDLRVHYVDEGPSDGPVMLLLHGMPTWGYLYRTMIPLLVDAGYRCIAPDHLGFGRSDKPTDANWYSIARHTEVLTSLITALDLR